jgi:hypothetical protein
MRSFIYGRPHFASPLLLYGLMAQGDLKAMTLYRNSIVTPLLPQGFPTTLGSLAIQIIAEKHSLTTQEELMGY